VPLLPLPPPTAPDTGVFGEVGSLDAVSGGRGPDEGTSGSGRGGADGPVGDAGVCGSGSGVRGGGGEDGAGGLGGGPGGEGSGADGVDALSTMREPLSAGGLWSGAGGGAGSATTSGAPDCAPASGVFVVSFLPSGSGVGSKRERSRACRPETPDDGPKVRLSCTPSTALFREIATLEFWPPPMPGSRGSPGRARPTHSAPANVAVAASPADSKVDRILEAIEARVGVRRMFSIFRQPQMLALNIVHLGPRRRPPTEGLGLQRTATARRNKPRPESRRRRS